MDGGSTSHTTSATSVMPSGTCSTATWTKLAAARYYANRHDNALARGQIVPPQIP